MDVHMHNVKYSWHPASALLYMVEQYIRTNIKKIVNMYICLYFIKLLRSTYIFNFVVSEIIPPLH